MLSDKFKRWVVIQKVTLSRGYLWLQVPMIGFIAASQLKLLFPAFFDGIYKFIALIILCTIGIWCVGYIDRKTRLLHAETSYGTEVNTFLVDMINNRKKDGDNKENTK